MNVREVSTILPNSRSTKYFLTQKVVADSVTERQAGMI